MRAGAADTPLTEPEVAALFRDLAAAPALVLAVSGGPDSTALMWLAARWRDRLTRPPELIAVTVDHGLRKESAREARAVARLAKKLSVDHHTVCWSGRKPKTGIQEAARNARYRLLGNTAHKAGARHILTAHTLDDQAETVLFRLARGSGVAGLRGMGRVSPLPTDGEGGLALVRPFLSIPKARLSATLAAAGIPFADDPSNRDPRFTRPRLRDLMPRLSAEGLDARRLETLARRMARADASIEHAVDEAAARFVRHDGNRLLIGARFGNLPSEVALRLLGRALARVGSEGPVELGKLEALHEALAAAMAQKGPGARFRRTLAGALVTLAAEITVEPAPARRSGPSRGGRMPKASFTKRR